MISAINTSPSEVIRSLSELLVAKHKEVELLYPDVLSAYIMPDLFDSPLFDSPPSENLIPTLPKVSFPD